MAAALSKTAELLSLPHRLPGTRRRDVEERTAPRFAIKPSAEVVFCLQPNVLPQASQRMASAFARALHEGHVLWRDVVNIVEPTSTIAMPDQNTTPPPSSRFSTIKRPPNNPSSPKINTTTPSKPKNLRILSLALAASYRGVRAKDFLGRPAP